MRVELYIMGSSARSNRAVKNVQRISECYPAGSFEYTIYDFLEKPELTHERNLVVSPTLIRIHPKPEIRLVGELDDIKKVVILLNEGSDFQSNESFADD